MNMLKNFSIGLAGIGLSLVLSTSAIADSLDLRLGTISPPGSPWAKFIESYSAKVNELSGGEINIDIFPGGQLGTEQNTMQMTLRGRLDMWVGAVPSMASVADEINLLSLPYLFKDFDETGCVVPKITADIDELFGKKLKFIGAMPAGFHGIGMKEPARLPTDLNQMKVRIAPQKTAEIFFRSIGSNAIPLPPTEMNTALSTGMVAGADAVLPFYMGVGTFKVAPVFVLTNHTYNTAGMVISGKTWKKMPKEQQDIMVQAQKEAFDLVQMQNVLNAVNNKLRGMLTQAGGTVIELTEAEMAAWVKAGKATHQDILDELRGDADGFMKKIQNAQQSCAI